MIFKHFLKLLEWGNGCYAILYLGTVIIILYLSAEANLQFSSCGLGGELKVNSTFADGTQCGGRVSDWNPRKCSVRSRMVLLLDQTCPHLHRHGE